MCVNWSTIQHFSASIISPHHPLIGRFGLSRCKSAYQNVAFSPHRCRRQGVGATYYLVPPLRLDEASLPSSQTSQPGITQPSGQKLLHYDEVQKHASEDDCWVIIDVSCNVELDTDTHGLSVIIGERLRCDRVPPKSSWWIRNHPCQRRERCDVSIPPSRRCNSTKSLI